MSEFTYTKKITAEQIDDLMSAGFEGMSYWCDEVTAGFLKEEDQGKWHSELLSRGYALQLHDSEEEKWHELTLEKLLKGLSLTDNLDFDNYDMYDAERVIQRALFGKEVYA